MEQLDRSFFYCMHFWGTPTSVRNLTRSEHVKGVKIGYLVSIEYTGRY